MHQLAIMTQFEQFAHLWLTTGQELECHRQGETEIRKMSPPFYATISIYVRLLGAAAINVIGLAIVTTTIPLFLCTSDSYMDFVLNAAATIFIVQLDDLTHSTTIVLEVQEMTSIIIRRGDDLPEYY